MMQTGIIDLITLAVARKEPNPSLISHLKKPESGAKIEKSFEPEVEQKIQEQSAAKPQHESKDATKAKPDNDDYRVTEEDVDPEVLEALSSFLPEAIIDFLYQLQQVAPAEPGVETLSAGQLAKMVSMLRNGATDEESFNMALEWMQEQGFVDDSLINDLPVADVALLAGLLGVAPDELDDALYQYLGDAKGLRETLMASAKELGLGRPAVDAAIARAMALVENPPRPELVLPQTPEEAEAFFQHLHAAHHLAGKGGVQELHDTATLQTLAQERFATGQNIQAVLSDEGVRAYGFGAGLRTGFYLGNLFGQNQLTSTTAPQALTAALQTADFSQFTPVDTTPVMTAAELLRSLAIGGDGKDRNSLAAQDADALTVAGQARDGTAASSRAEAQASVRANATQESGVLVRDQLVVNISRMVNQGNRQMRIQLDPPEMGRITINMELGQDGKTQLMISSDNRDTLSLLQRDSRELAQALKDLGLDANASDMEFSLEEHSRPDVETAQDHGVGAGNNGNGSTENESGTNSADKSANSESGQAAELTMDQSLIEAFIDRGVLNMSDAERELLEDFALLRGTQFYGKQRIVEEKLDIEV